MDKNRGGLSVTSTSTTTTTIKGVCNNASNLLAKMCKVRGSYLTRATKVAQAGRLGCGNDPSAGSPTETLLRLHLPLNDEV